MSTVTKTVIDFIVKPYEISGTLKYTYNNYTLPAYGVNVKMAICSDMYSRYKDESRRHSNIPQAL